MFFLRIVNAKLLYELVGLSLISHHVLFFQLLRFYLKFVLEFPMDILSDPEVTANKYCKSRKLSKYGYAKLL